MKIKEKPEDFIVTEQLILPDLEENYSENNQYAYFLMEKKNFNTMSAIMIIARVFGTTIKNACFCGNKDKLALTYQYVCIKVNRRILRKIKKNIEIGGEKSYIKLKRLGYSNKSLFLGAHESNKFEIKLRDVSKSQYKNLKEKIKQIKNNNNYFVNYFGEQRFSTNNIKIGKLLIKNKFKEVFEIISDSYRDLGNQLKKKYEKTKDYVSTLRSIPRKHLSLYINAYQSYLWNKVAKFANKLITKKFDIEIPLFGFGTDFQEYLDSYENSESNKKKKQLEIIKKVFEYYDKILKKENLRKRDFVIKQIPHISAHGTLRYLYRKVKNLRIKELEENENTNIITLTFELPKSCYATTLIKELTS